MSKFTREGILGCVVYTLEELKDEIPLSREQIQDILDIMAGELDTTSNKDAEKNLGNFYSDNL